MLYVAKMMLYAAAKGIGMNITDEAVSVDNRERVELQLSWQVRHADKEQIGKH